MHLSRSAYQGYEYVRKGISNRGCTFDGALADTLTRVQELPKHAKRNRNIECMRPLASILSPGIFSKHVKYNANTECARSHRIILVTRHSLNTMCHMLVIVLYFASLVFTQVRAQVISSTVPAHRISYRLLIVFTFWDAVLYPHECSSALKYRACAQNVSDVTHIVYILGCWPTPR